MLNSWNLDKSVDSIEEQEENGSILNYLGGNGCITWSPNNSESPILEKLMHFRDINIAGAQQSKILNDIRILYVKACL